MILKQPSSERSHLQRLARTAYGSLSPLMWIVLLGFPPLITAASFLFHLSLMTGTILSFVIPSLVLAFHIGKPAWRIAGISLLLLLPMTIIFDPLNVLNGAWMVRSSILPWRLFGITPIEMFVWGWSLAFLMILLYESTVDKHRNIPRSQFPPSRLIIIDIVLIAIFSVLIMVAPWLLKISWSYAFSIIVAMILPALFYLRRHQQAIEKFALIQLLILYMAFWHEIAAVGLDWWSFPGQTILGWISIGSFRIPWEEFLWWAIVAFAGLSFFEYVADDRK